MSYYDHVDEESLRALNRLAEVLGLDGRVEWGDIVAAVEAIAPPIPTPEEEPRLPAPTGPLPRVRKGRIRLVKETP